jgi:restriction system protein
MAPIPTYDCFIEPVLRYLAEHPEGALARDVHCASAQALGLSEDEMRERLPSGAQLVFKNRSGWAHDRLKRAGLSSSPKRGTWRLTEAGVEYVKENIEPLSKEVVEELAMGFNHIRLRPSEGNGKPKAPKVVESPSQVSVSPDERLELAHREIQESIAGDLLENIANCSPLFFESLVLDLLHSMGYGANRDSITHVGGSGDGGIDGVISLDRLGLEKVYVQAKRWKGSVGRPEIQAFFGALAGQRATKGVFITTSFFTDQANEFAESVGQVVLVAGDKLAAHMIEFGIGVSHKVLRVPSVDTDYFED